MPSWNPDVAEAITDAVRAACPDVIINMSTGVMGKDVSEPVACLKRTKPEIAACNAGTLNYLKTRRDGNWAWPPMIFLNGVPKISKMLAAMKETGTLPEMECFDEQAEEGGGRCGTARECRSHGRRLGDSRQLAPPDCSRSSREEPSAQGAQSIRALRVPQG